MNNLKLCAFSILVVLVTIATVPAQVRADALPPDEYTEWTSEKEIFVSMRDGVRLSTDVHLPKGAKGRLPTVLIRTPYDRDNFEWRDSNYWYELFLKHGYALVHQSERGRFFSEGTFEHFLEGAGTDGYDTIEWITKQPWSNGKVGTFGCSSTGEQQWPMANSKHPAHAAMLPLASGTAVGSVPGNDTQGAIYRGGIPQLSLWAWWYYDMVPTERLLLPANSTQEERIRLRKSFSLMPLTWFYTIEPRGKVDLAVAKNDIAKLLRELPSKDVLRRIGGAQTPFDDFITWTPGDPRWEDVATVKAGFSSRTPAIHINSWHDIGAGEMTRLFKHVQDQNTPDQFLIIGPGPHCIALRDNNTLKELKFGDIEVTDARYRGRDDGYAQLFLAWFDHFLKGNKNAVTDMPKVQLYVMGKGWISANRWPLEKTSVTKYYLGSANIAGSKVAIERSLSTVLPKGERSESYLYDPANPVPSRGGNCCSQNIAVDQRGLEMRRDVLSYSTEVLKKAVTVAGPIEVVLYVSSSVKDTDFIVKLVDVRPDGTAINLSDDGFRVRYRAGFGKKVLMKPGEVYPIRLTNMVTANHFQVGHRIRLDITSSNFPDYERNLNTGGNNFDETAWVTAENTIHHSAAYPSHVAFPILPD